MANIKIHISPEGDIKIETSGYAGQSCQSATRAIEEALGKVKSEALTQEYYLQGDVEQHIEAERG